MFNSTFAKNKFIQAFLFSLWQFEIKDINALHDRLADSTELCNYFYNASIKFIHGKLLVSEIEEFCEKLFKHCPVIFSNIIHDNKILPPKQGSKKFQMLMMTNNPSHLDINSDFISYITDPGLFSRLLELPKENEKLPTMLKIYEHEFILSLMGRAFLLMCYALGGEVYHNFFEKIHAAIYQRTVGIQEQFLTASRMPNYFDVLHHAVNVQDSDKIDQLTSKILPSQLNSDLPRRYLEYLDVRKKQQQLLLDITHELLKLDTLICHPNSLFASELIKLVLPTLNIKTRYADDLGPKKKLTVKTEIQTSPGEFEKYVAYFKEISGTSFLKNENKIIITETDSNRRALLQFITSKRSIIAELLKFLNNKPIDIKLSELDITTDETTTHQL